MTLSYTETRNGVNIFAHLRARTLKGPTEIINSLPTEVYSRMKCYRRLMGHLSSCYCVCFDQTGQFIFTGADDHLIKIWSATDGRLLKTLRGHDGQISDMCVNYENRLLASAGMDKIIRIWDLKTTKLLECLNAHCATVTSIKFSPYNRHEESKNRFMISTSNDGSIVFWVYDAETFQFKKYQKYRERNRPGGQIVCSSFSTGGSFLACGSSDNFIHVYGFAPTGPYWQAELGAHQDKVDSVQFCNNGFRFVSGSKDGTAIIWTYKAREWKPLKLDMNITLPDDQPPPRPHRFRPKVLIVQWSSDDRYVMTSIVDYSIKVWDSRTGELMHVLREHTLDVYLIESHPIDPRIFVSASHDGNMIVWDIERGKVLKKILNSTESQGNEPNNWAAIFDIKFSPDGTLIAATDSHGCLILYGMGSGEIYRKIPDQMFFHTDYRALIRDVRQFVMDEQTHLAPHLMPKPTLVDMNGNPYPHSFQHLVPDYKDYRERPVVKPLSQALLDSMTKLISRCSFLEDEDYLLEKDQRLTRSQNQLHDYEQEEGNSNDSTRYNTRYSARSAFRSARTQFENMSARRARRQIRYFEDEEEEDEGSSLHYPVGSRHRPRRRAARQSQLRRRQLYHINGTHSDSSTEIDDGRNDSEIDDVDTEVDTDVSTEVNTEAETEIDTEIAESSTEIDSDATEIDDQNIYHLRQSNRYNTRYVTQRQGNLSDNYRRDTGRPVRRCSARLRDRKRVRRN